MIIGVPVTGNKPSGPGEAEEVVLLDTASGKEVERYQNPALTATSGRGIAMIRSLLERKVEAMVVAGIGEHAFEVARRTLRVMSGEGLTLEEIMQKARDGSLHDLTGPNHGEHHH